VIADLSRPELAERFPLLRQPLPPPKGGTRAAVILITSNRGLAGGFNANLIKEARAASRRSRPRATPSSSTCMGKKGIGYFKYSAGLPQRAHRHR
jgi:F-type H+-transporting ATPase subunit gamma